MQCSFVLFGLISVRGGRFRCTLTFFDIVQHSIVNYADYESCLKAFISLAVFRNVCECCKSRVTGQE